MVEASKTTIMMIGYRTAMTDTDTGSSRGLNNDTVGQGTGSKLEMRRETGVGRSRSIQMWKARYR